MDDDERRTYEMRLKQVEEEAESLRLELRASPHFPSFEEYARLGELRRKKGYFQTLLDGENAEHFFAFFDAVNNGARGYIDTAVVKELAAQGYAPAKRWLTMFGQ